jgi:hypothetical protein
MSVDKLFVLSMLLISLVGCNKNDDKDDIDDPTPVSTSHCVTNVAGCEEWPGSFSCASAASCYFTKAECDESNECNGSDEDQGSLDVMNQIVVGSNTFTLREGWLDFGEEGYQYADLVLSEGDIELFTTILDGVQYTWPIAVRASVAVSAELYYPGLNFTNGTYVYSEGHPSGQYTFGEGYVELDQNGDRDFSDDEQIAIVSGTIEIQGTASNYSVTINVQLANGLNARGTYTGSFLVIGEP